VQAAVSSLCNLKWFPKRGFPLIFHCVYSRHSKAGDGDSKSKSLVNDAEVKVVCDYAARLRGLMDDHSIGIISPYKGQGRDSPIFKNYS
jgi:hypothetical protein